MELVLAIAKSRYVEAPPAIQEFIEWTEGYQSNHYGNFDTDGYLRVYLMLPQEMKDFITYRSRGFLWRGDEFYTDHLYDEYRKGRTYPALSFTPKQGIAKHFGTPKRFNEIVESCAGFIDMRNLVAYLNKQKFEHDIGDDEGEVICLQVKLK